MANIVNKTDRRAKLTAKAPFGSTTFNQIFGDNNEGNILQPLHRTKGIVFPYTPNIVWQSGADYEESHMTHSNYRYNMFDKAYSGPFQVDANFTAQTDAEARYMLAVMHFFKVITKMNFGEQAGSNRGVPPPVLQFSYLGNYMFNQVPVIVRTVNYNLESDVDYVPVRFTGKHERTTYVPTQLHISVELGIQMNTKTVRQQFNLESFTDGSYLDGSGKFKGWL